MAEGLLAGKVALVTGVSGGLGRAVVLAYVKAGASVVGVARRTELGEELAAEVGSERFAFVAADQSRVADCERAVNAAVERFGRLDVVVNNAAIRPDPPLMSLHDTDEATWDRVCDTNLKGPFFLTKYAVGPMRAQGGGVIINIASICAEIAIRGMSVYSTTKAGLAHLSRLTAVEYLNDGIRANAIILGGTATGQANRTAASAQEAGAAIKDGAEAAVLLDPDEVAETLVLLASDGAKTVTGATIAIDYATTAGAWSSEFTHQTIAILREQQGA